MDVTVFLILIGVMFAIVVLICLLWAIKSGQYDDLEGAASIVLYDEDKNEK